MANARLAESAKSPMPSPKRFGGMMSLATVELEVLVMPHASPWTKRSANMMPTTGMKANDADARDVYKRQENGI